MAIKFLQTSDWHLGTKMASFPKGVADSWRTQAASCISSIIKSAIEEDIKLIFLPGDMFDNVKPSEKVKAVFRSILRSVNDRIHIFLIPGTHDYYSLNGLWDDPDFSQINVFKSEGYSSFYLEDLNVEIWGVPVYKENRDKNWLANPPELNSARKNILLYHGDYRGTGREYDKWDFPFELKDLENSGFDYVALGHHHKGKLIKSGDRTIGGYSGTPVGWSYRKSELGERNYLTGEISESGISVELKTSGCSLIHSFRMNLSNPLESENLVREIEELEKGDILRLLVSGKDFSGVKPGLDEIMQKFRCVDFIEDKGGEKLVDPSDNYHLKVLLDKLEGNWKNGDIDEEFYNRLVERALSVFS